MRSHAPVQLLAAAGVLTQIASPLLDGQALRIVTVLSVLLLAAAAVLHAAAVWRPVSGAALLMVAGGIGLAAETVGVHTGLPFGHYSYTGNLGPRLAGVPLLVPLAWTMLAYPCLVLGRQLSATTGHGSATTSPPGAAQRLVTVASGAICLAGWDLFLDPQMVAAGNWAWAHPSPALPGVPGVPLTNYAGWLLVAIGMIAVLDRTLPVQDGARTISRAGQLTPALVLTWTWLGSTVGNLVFFDRPWVALYGGLVMGSLIIPYLLSLAAAPNRAATPTLAPIPNPAATPSLAATPRLAATPNGKPNGDTP